MEVQKDEVKVTHFVYPYRLSEGDNLYDLQYSIRSLYKHFKDPFDVTVIGALPPYLDETKGVRFIPLPPLGNRPQINITNAQITACCLYDEWVNMNDDHIFVNDFVIDDFKHLYSIGMIRHGRDSNPPLRSFAHKLKNAMMLLEDLNKPTVNYANHIPVIFNSRMFLDMVRDCDLDSLTNVGGIPSDVVYFNYHYDTLVKTWEERKTDTIRLGFWSANLQKINQLKNLPDTIKILNFDENGYKQTPYIKKFLEENYAEKSPLETLEKDIDDNNKQ